MCAVKHNFKRRTRVKIHETENADSFEAHSLPNDFRLFRFLSLFFYGTTRYYIMYTVYTYTLTSNYTYNIYIYLDENTHRE